MDYGVRERVEALRQEIAELQKLDLAYLQTPRREFTAIDAHTRQEKRLKEITDELRSMTAWKTTRKKVKFAARGVRCSYFISLWLSYHA